MDPRTTLREVQPGDVGLDAETLEELPGIIRAGLEFDPPRFAGASVLVASQAGIAIEHADGYALRWKDASKELPEDQWIPARTDTIYDLASISKIFTATAVMQLVEKGVLALDDTVSSYLPRFAENGKAAGHRAAAAHARRRPAGLHQPLLRLSRCALAPRCGADRRRRRPPRAPSTSTAIWA